MYKGEKRALNILLLRMGPWKSWWDEGINKAKDILENPHGNLLFIIKLIKSQKTHI